ncbi:MAG: cytochrome c biogenesis protein CcdA, partial [Ferruginibacter sp.]
LFLLFFSFFISGLVFSQDSAVVKWSAEAKKISGNQYQLSLKGFIKKGWHVYDSNRAQDLAGLVVSFDDSLVNPEAIHLNTKSKTINDVVFDSKDMQVTTDSIVFTQKINLIGQPLAVVKIKLNYETGDAGNFLPEEQKIIINLEPGAVTANTNRILIPSINLDEPLTECGAGSASALSVKKSTGLLSLFVLGFLGGLVALLTPCVFPMIPLTVSFFTKKSVNRKAGIKNAFIYGFFILLIYIFLSLPFHFLDKLNPEILNNISTNVYLNILFFIIFIVFALSFFGLYEITLPAAISNSTDSKAGVGNIAGIFFMALTLALVSFSCTGPILGSLLAGSLSADGGAMQLTVGMGGFGLALALPFALFALFPNMLGSLPKSGGWLTTVKVVLGFLELGLAFKFLSNADLVKHWGLLKREIFIGIWVLVGAGLTLYLFGLLKFKHDSPIKKLSVIRIGLGILAGVFTLYLIPGLTNTKAANLSLISGFPPPLYYSIYKSGNDCVLDLNCTRDYEEGLKMAREQNKPILLDFTGYACVNCRRMEENVWSKPEVYKLMKEKFIVISLYVDDKKKLLSSQQFTYKSKSGDQKEIITVGDKWATFETENFKNNAQPLYAILNNEEQLLSHPVGYVPSVKEYGEWLQCGVNVFYKKEQKFSLTAAPE